MFDAIISFLSAMIRYSTPLLFVSLGVMVMEIAGVVNMGAEGMMIIGCLAGVVATAWLGNVWLGALVAMLVAGIFGLLFALLVLEFQINQVVLGVAFNLVGAGLTTTLNRAFFDGMSAGDTFGQIGTFPIPTYIAVLLVILCWVALYKMKIGVQMRSVGENPVVVESVGISVKRLRYMACVAGGMLVGLLYRHFEPIHGKHDGWPRIYRTGCRYLRQVHSLRHTGRRDRIRYRRNAVLPSAGRWRRLPL